MAAAGEDVIDLGLGEPDFDTPAHIVEAAHRAAQAGETRYPPTGGTAAMKAAVIEKFREDNALAFRPEEVIVANGAKQAIFDAMMATLEPGQEVILCAPYFDSYQNIVSLLGGCVRVVRCRAEEGFRLTPEALAAAMTPATRWLVLNAPSNPAGAVYGADDFRVLGAVLARYPGVLILSDEIYEKIVFDGFRMTSFAAACPELQGRVLTVNGVSKAYAMTGWRIGYAGGPAPLVKAMTTVQSLVSSGACSVAQAAAAAALSGPQDCVVRFRSTFERRRDLVVERLARIAGLSLVPPKGAFYALIDCSRLIGARAPDGTVIGGDRDFAAFLLRHARIAGVPGSVYGTPGTFRISTACADAVLGEALERLANAVDALKTTTEV